LLGAIQGVVRASVSLKEAMFGAMRGGVKKARGVCAGVKEVVMSGVGCLFGWKSETEVVGEEEEERSKVVVEKMGKESAFVGVEEEWNHSDEEEEEEEVEGEKAEEKKSVPAFDYARMGMAVERGLSGKVGDALYEVFAFGAQMTVSVLGACIRACREDVPRIGRAIQHEVHMFYHRKFEAECRRAQRLRRSGAL